MMIMMMVLMMMLMLLGHGAKVRKGGTRDYPGADNQGPTTNGTEGQVLDKVTSVFHAGTGSRRPGTEGQGQRPESRGQR